MKDSTVVQLLESFDKGGLSLQGVGGYSRGLWRCQKSPLFEASSWVTEPVRLCCWQKLLIQSFLLKWS